MARCFRIEYVIRAASELPNQSARHSDTLVVSWSVSQAKSLLVVQFLQLLNQSVTQPANQIVRNLTIEPGNESGGQIGLYDLFFGQSV